jgi:hypothetical protein
VGDSFFLKSKARRSYLKLGNFSQSETHYYGAFENLEKIGHVTYMMEFFALLCTHNVFHVYFLKKCVHDSNNVIDWNVI